MFLRTNPCFNSLSAMSYFELEIEYSSKIFVQTGPDKFYFACYIPKIQEFHIYDIYEMKRLRKVAIFRRKDSQPKHGIVHKTVNMFQPEFDHDRIILQEDRRLTLVDLYGCREIGHYVTDFDVRISFYNHT